jgi:hypothetical protein
MHHGGGAGIVVATNFPFEGMTMRRFLMAAAILAGLALCPPPATADASGALDARAAAARDGGVTSAGATSGAGLQATWYSGTVAPGATQSWYWNNANPLEAAYQVGFNPVGATTGKACGFETINTIYQRMANGERKFFFTIKNIGSVACGTTVLLAASAGSYLGNTGTLTPGQSQTWSATFSGFTSVQVPGVVPAATGTPCQTEVLRSWNSYAEVGVREFHFTVRNVGSVACTANLYLGSVPRDISWRTFTNFDVGETYLTTWNNANPLNAVYVPIAYPFALPFDTVCELEVVRSYYRQVINASGFPERRFTLEIHNVGQHSCNDVHIGLATLAA